MPETATMPKDLVDELNMDIAQSLRAVVGERPESFVSEFQPNTSGYPNLSGAGFGGTSALNEFVKNNDPVEDKVKFTDNKMYVLDVAIPEQHKIYTEVMGEACDPESGVVLAEETSAPQIILDPSSAAGYRAIVVIKTTRPVSYKKQKGKGYQQIKPSKKQ